MNKPAPGTQTGEILKYLKRGRSLTPIQALNIFGCFRLGARIWDLKRLGFQIEMQRVKVGPHTHVAQYTMKRGKV
jgi:hypothetical protein